MNAKWEYGAAYAQSQWRVYARGLGSIGMPFIL
jgi:hypothetical protein